MELVATAAYHALFEFGVSVGVDNPSQYEILLSDPREDQDRIWVGLMREDRDTYREYDGSPHQRKPDLVLEGEGEKKRRWVELKSWRYRPEYLSSSGNSLKKTLFPLWDGVSNGTRVKKYTTKAHKQAFLDYAATRSPLANEYWAGKPFRTLKPSKTTTWIQVWKPGKRTWRELKRENGRYTIGKKTVTINVATPWLRDSDMSRGLVTGISPQFKALQRYLTAAPGMNGNAFEASIGYPHSDHEERYGNNQIANSAASLAAVNVRPFTLSTFFAVEAGENVGGQLKHKLLDSFGSEEWAELEKAIDNGTLTEEQIEALREEITDKMLEILGPFKYVAVDVPLLSDLENAVVDYFTGDEVEKMRQFAAEFELNEDFFEVACEAP